MPTIFRKMIGPSIWIDHFLSRDGPGRHLVESQKPPLLWPGRLIAHRSHSEDEPVGPSQLIGEAVPYTFRREPDCSPKLGCKAPCEGRVDSWRFRRLQVVLQRLGQQSKLKVAAARFSKPSNLSAPEAPHRRLIRQIDRADN